MDQTISVRTEEKNVKKIKLAVDVDRNYQSAYFLSVIAKRARKRTNGYI